MVCFSDSVVRDEHADSPGQIHPGRAIGSSSQVWSLLCVSSHGSVVEELELDSQTEIWFTVLIWNRDIHS